MAEITITLKYRRSAELAHCLAATDAFLGMPNKPEALAHRAVVFGETRGSMVMVEPVEDGVLLMKPTPDFAQLADDIWLAVDLAAKRSFAAVNEHFFAVNDDKILSARPASCLATNGTGVLRLYTSCGEREPIDQVTRCRYCLYAS